MFWSVPLHREGQSCQDQASARREGHNCVGHHCSPGVRGPLHGQMEQTRQRGQHKLHQRILLDASWLWEDKIHVQVSQPFAVHSIGYYCLAVALLLEEAVCSSSASACCLLISLCLMLLVSYCAMHRLPIS